jgi:hypothetical protein
MHGSAFGQASIFGVLDDWQVEFGAEAQSGTHGVIFEDRFAVIGDGDCTGALERGEVSQLGAARTASGGSDGKNIDESSTLGAK